MTGEAFVLLVDLVERGIVRILDLVFVRKKPDGSVVVVEIADLDRDGELDLTRFEGASSGLLDQEDIEEAGSVLEPGTSAEQSMYVSLWWLRTGGLRCVSLGQAARLCVPFAHNCHCWFAGLDPTSEEGDHEPEEFLSEL